MRRAWVAFAAVLAAGLVALVVIGLTNTSALAYSIGVVPASPIDVPRGERACQGPIRLPEGTSFDRVAFTIGTYQRPGQPVRIDVHEAGGTGRRLATGRLEGGYGDVDQVPEHVVPVGRVGSGVPVEICLLNEGNRKLALFGQAGQASPRTQGSLDGAPVDVDFGFTMLTEERSLLALLPDMAERAALFRAGWISPAVYLVLGLLILVGAPLLLARGLARAAAEDGA